jgi:hypothetical protein
MVHGFSAEAMAGELAGSERGRWVDLASATGGVEGDWIWGRQRKTSALIWERSGGYFDEWASKPQQ